MAEVLHEEHGIYRGDEAVCRLEEIEEGVRLKMTGYYDKGVESGG